MYMYSAVFFFVLFGKWKKEQNKDRPERPMLTNRNKERVIYNKFTECHLLRPGMDACEWSRLWHFLSKVKLKFFAPDGG